MENASELYERMEREQEAKELQSKYGKDSFTPQFDFLIQYSNGQTLASVYGKIWRYCQMGNGRCEISIKRVARELGIGYSTADRAIKWLCHNGLVWDMTPDAGNNIHYYRTNEEEHLRQTVAYNQHTNAQSRKPKILVQE